MMMTDYSQPKNCIENFKFILIIGLFLGFTLLLFCNTVSATDTSQTAVSDNIIHINKNGFYPLSITVKSGTTVRWVNEDSTTDPGLYNPTHRIELVNIKNSPLLSSGQGWSWIFDQPGSYDYNDMIHSTLQGTIIVKNEETVTGAPTTTQTSVLTTQTTTPSTLVKVHISYLGGFKGTYGLASNLQSIQSSGDQVYQITNAAGPIQVDIQKTDGSSQNDLLVEIYKDNSLLTQGSTKHPFGHVIITVDANTGVADVYLPTPTVTSTQTTLSTTTVIATSSTNVVTTATTTQGTISTTTITPQATPGTTIPTTVTTTGSPTSLTTVPTTSQTTINTPTPTPTPNYDAKIAALESQLAVQNQKIEEQGNILDKITNFLRNIFGWK